MAKVFRLWYKQGGEKLLVRYKQYRTSAVRVGLLLVLFVVEVVVFFVESSF